MTESVEEMSRDLRAHKKKMKDKLRDIYEVEQKQHATQLENFELITTLLKSHWHSPSYYPYLLLSIDIQTHYA